MGWGNGLHTPEFTNSSGARTGVLPVVDFFGREWVALLRAHASHIVLESVDLEFAVS